MKIHILQSFVLITITATLSVAHQERPADRAAFGVSKTQSLHTLIAPESIKWIASGTGQWGAPYVIRLKLVDGAKIAPPWHPGDEHVTVVTGTLCVGMGGEFDESLTEGMPPGSYLLMPKEMRHFARAKGETIIQIHGIGPFKTYRVGTAEEQSKK